MAARYIWLTLLFVVVCGAAFGPQLFSSQPVADEELVIISPHWDGIRHEFGLAFEKWYFDKTKKHVQVTWLDLGGGTGEIKKYLEEKFKNLPVSVPVPASANPAVKSFLDEKLKKQDEEGIGADILFGGGMDMLPQMAQKNFFEPYVLSPEQLKDLPAEINGQELRDKKMRYHAACLSTFGFVYNRLVMQQASLPVPKRWDDLGRPEFQGWVSCGDPSNSGSLHMAFELILQGQGWQKGSETLTRMISDVRSFNEGGVSIPRDVSLGQAAVGPCIDFYASAPVRRQGATHLQLVIPEGMSVATPDCIAVLRNQKHRDAAFAFVEFVLSEAGQRLWYQTRGDSGGPVDYDLERLPVMPRIYDMGLKTNTLINPFKDKPDFKYDSKKGGERWGTLNDLWHAVLIDVHEDLWSARKAIIAARRDNDLGAALCRAPMGEEAILSVAKQRLPAESRNDLRNKWSAWARNWYRQIENAAKRNGPVPEFTPAKTSL